MSHLKKAPNPNWTCAPTSDLKVNISSNESRWHLAEGAFPRYPEQACIPFAHCCFFYIIFSLSVLKIMILSVFPNLLPKEETFLTVLIRHQKLWSVHDIWDPLVLPVTHFSCFPAPKGNINGMSSHCKDFRKESFKMWWYFTKCYPNSSYPWLEKVKQEIPAYRSFNDQTLTGVLWAPPGFIFVYGKIAFPKGIWIFR